MKLTICDKKVLLRIEHEMANVNQTYLSEFPKLKKKEIKKSIMKLNELGLIELQDGMWITTKKGEDYLIEYSELFVDILNEFNNNLYNQWKKKEKL